MIGKRIKENGTELVDIIQNRGNTDYVKGEKVIRNAPMKMVLVTGSGDLAKLTNYEPGTIAYTAAFVNMWQLAASGTWVEFE